MNGNPLWYADYYGLETQGGLGVGGTVFGPPLPQVPWFGIGAGGSLAGGISTDGTMCGSQLFIAFQINLMSGSGAYVGGGIQGTAGRSDGPLTPSIDIYGHFEANVGVGAEGGGMSAQYDGDGVISGSGSLRAGPGFGLMGGSGMATVITVPTPVVGDIPILNRLCSCED